MAIVSIERHSFVMVEFFKILQPLFVIGVFNSLLENFHLIEGGFKIMRSRFLNLDGDVGIELGVFAKPHSGKMTPTQFLENHVPAIQNFPDVHWVVTPFFVVVYSFVFGVNGFLFKFLSQNSHGLYLRVRGMFV
jgi:hypothetical protein